MLRCYENWELSLAQTAYREPNSCYPAAFATLRRRSLTNERVGLIELKLSNRFDPNDPNSKDDFAILLTGAIKAGQPESHGSPYGFHEIPGGKVAQGRKRRNC